MTRIWLPSLAAALALSACSAPVPDSGAGVGFGDYDAYIQERLVRPAPATTVQAPAARSDSGPVAAVPAPAPVAPAPVQAAAPAPTAAPSAAEINTALGRPAPAAPAAPVGEPLSALAPASAAPAPTGGISDEQSFDAVSARETIESDAARRARQQAEYQAVAPTAVPERPADTGPDLVKYALSTSNQPGVKAYRRGFTSQGRYNRACNSFASPALAQQAFLASGGPNRDRKGVDPDGDGFACGWDPQPFRSAAAAN